MISINATQRLPTGGALHGLGSPRQIQTRLKITREILMISRVIFDLFCDD